jgi:hypothetical protein
MKIFQYCDEGGAVILETLELRLTPPDEFNDPFEFAPTVNPASREQTRRHLLDNFDEWYEYDGQRLGVGDRSATRRYFLDHVDSIVDGKMKQLPAFAEILRQQFSAMASRLWVVGSFSKIDDSILMWSHYAEKHTGIVIGFDAQQRPFYAPNILVVEYGEKKPIYSHRSESNEEFAKEFHKVARSKFKHWEYEQEVRILMPRSRSLREGRYMALEPQSVVSVCFGCRTPEAYRQRVRAALAKPHFQHVKLYEAKLSPSDYKVDIELCS